ncbi:hypothetical protein RH857_05275 [Nesterenkonia flava]|uniref:DUF308 domain-containing protein n=1 Tax=Nesterenkonia flava TaxID=469799 RepID=A0ABU1FS99_9MICC|nr:hypothetical protein [Nesterenkonia flava]
MKRTPPETAQSLARPAWLRAGTTIGFSVFSIVWHGNAWFADLWDGNDLMVARIAVAAFFVLTASMVWEYVKQEGVPEVLRGSLALGAAAWLLTGVLVIFMTTTTGVALAAGAGFLILGLAELFGGLRTRNEFVPSRDHALLGAIGALTGLLMIAWWGLDIHGVIGIAGMGMILSSVLLAIGAAGLTHDAKRAAA